MLDLVDVLLDPALVHLEVCISQACHEYLSQLCLCRIRGQHERLITSVPGIWHRNSSPLAAATEATPKHSP